MQILVLRNLGSDLPRYTEGQVVDCDTAVAEMLVRRGLAEAIVVAPAKAPAIAEAKPVEMKAVQPEPLAAKAFDKSPSKQGK